LSERTKDGTIMEIQTFITDSPKGLIGLDILTTIAAQRAAHGDDVIGAFASQLEQRSAKAQQVLDTAAAANRDALLASEQRSYDAALRERDNILSLLRHVEQRTAQAAYVPRTQVIVTETRTEVSPVLTREQRAWDWLQARGGYAYQGERGAETARLGAVIRALATGRRDGLSDVERRALEEGTGSAGGFTVPEILATRWIDRMRNALVTQRAGAVIVPMTSDTLHLARLAQPGMHDDGSPRANAAIGAWKVENAPIAESAMELERVTFTARTLPMLIKLSVELSEDSANIDQIIETEMARSMALEVDRVALLGSGVAPEPQGIKGADNVQTDTLGSPADWDFLVDAAGMLWAENHEPSAVIWSPEMAVSAAKFKDTNDGQPLRMPEELQGLPRLRTNQVSADVFVGDFAQLMIGLRTSFRLEVSRTAGDAFENLQLHVRAYLRGDIQLAHPEAFVVLS
jgi:HK97 family phage major capsid protein